METLDFKSAHVLNTIKKNKPNILRKMKEENAEELEEDDLGTVIPFIVGAKRIDIPIKEWNKLVRQYKMEMPDDPEDL